MQLTTIVSLLAAAMAVNAAPGSPVQERQATPTIYAQFFPDGGCHGSWIDDIVFAQSGSDCVNNGVTSAYASANFSGNTASKTRKSTRTEEAGNAPFTANSQGLLAAKLR